MAQGSILHTLPWNLIGRSHQFLLGQKCYLLAKHKQAGHPVPPFFALTNRRVAEILENGDLSIPLQRSIDRRLKSLEEETGLELGNEQNPLLLSVRSGDPRSMHGMLLSIMNIGLNDRTFPGLVGLYGEQSRQEGLWLYLNLIVDFAVEIKGIERAKIRPLLNLMKNKEWNSAQLDELIGLAKNIGRDYSLDFTFPQDVREQLTLAVKAVAFSWRSETARCAAAALGLGPNELPSVFIQQMAFSNLTPDSAFCSLLTNPGPHGIFAPHLSGRRVMSGTAKSLTFKIEELPEHFPVTAERIDRLCQELVREEKKPLNIELVIDRGKLWLLQVCHADLSPAVHAEAIRELVEKSVLNEAEAARELAEVQVKKPVKVFKLNPAAKLELISRGMPGAPGAIAGKLALTPSQALELSKSGERVILFSTEALDEKVYHLTLGNCLAGIIASYGLGRGSHIADFASANGIPMVASLRPATMLDGRGDRDAIYLEGKPLRAGARVVIDGARGEVYLTYDPEPVIEDKEIVTLSWGINYLELFHSIQTRYQAYSYEELLREHAAGVVEVGAVNVSRISREQLVGLQARIHCLHLLARQMGEKMGKNKLQVDLDVAVADGNLDRVPGLEDRELTIRSEKGRLIIVTGAVDDNEAYDLSGGPLEIGDVQIDKLLAAAREAGLILQRDIVRRKPSLHTQEIVEYRVSFPPELLRQAVEFLQGYYQPVRKNGLG